MSVINVVLQGSSWSSNNNWVEFNLFDRGLGTIWTIENLVRSLKIVFEDAVGHQERGWLYKSSKSQEKKEHSASTFSRNNTCIFFVSMMKVTSTESNGWVYNASSSRVTMKLKTLEFDNPETLLGFVIRHSGSNAAP
jgi:hypothetical protein